MGDFSIACSISGLPVFRDDKVRVLRVRAAKYPDQKCDPTLWWIPCSWPLRATYDSYGHFENVEDHPFARWWESQEQGEIREHILQSDVFQKSDTPAVVIREDVWSLLLSLSPSEAPTLRELRETTPAILQLFREEVPRDDISKMIHLITRWREHPDERFWKKAALFSGMEPLERPLLKAFIRIVWLTPEEQDGSLANDLAECLHIWQMVRELGRPWTPSTTINPQFPHWGFWESFAGGIQDISKQNRLRENAENESFNTLVPKISPPSFNNRLEVVSALILDEDGRLLLTKRHSNTLRPDMWETPGGKIDLEDAEGLDPRDPRRHHVALARELREELDVDAEVVDFVTAVDFLWDRPCTLFLYRCRILSGVPTALEAADLQYVKAEHAFKHLPMVPSFYNFYADLRSYLEMEGFLDV